MKGAALPGADPGSTPAQAIFPVEPVALCDLAQRVGLGFADVVALAEIPSTTLNRLWKDPAWATRSTGATLQLLLDVVPTLTAYLEGRAFTSRVEQHLRVLTASGITVRLPRTGDGARISAMSNALGVAAAIVTCDAAQVKRRLALGWALGHDQSIDAVFATGPGSLFGEERSVLANASEIRLVGQQSASASDIVGSGVLAHKIAKYGALDTGLPERPSVDRNDIRSAFIHRSLTIGGILRDGDPGVVRRYQREVATNPATARNEAWSLLTYNSGQRLPVDFSLPAATPTLYSGVLRDAAVLNDAYLGYLATTHLVGTPATTGVVAGAVDCDTRPSLVVWDRRPAATPCCQRTPSAPQKLNNLEKGHRRYAWRRADHTSLRSERRVLDLDDSSGYRPLPNPDHRPCAAERNRAGQRARCPGCRMRGRVSGAHAHPTGCRHCARPPGTPNTSPTSTPNSPSPPSSFGSDDLQS
ncbi:hypothetical protein AB0F85_31990 [Nocardia fluminea]|uniref:hypothetical protein n=1 Tax=Nocardia fluminea TaxID=134984 RepID=UPI0033FA0C7E